MKDPYCLTRNIGGIDRISRGVAGPLLLVLPTYFSFPRWTIPGLGAIGGMWLIAAAGFGW